MSIQLKRSLTSELDSSYVLKQGQIGIEMPSSTNTSLSAFRFKIGDGQTAWSSLPYAAATDPHTHSEYLTTTGTAASATKLASSRTIQVNLGSTSSASFDGTSNITPGVTGTLPVTRGGTGVTSINALKTALGVGSSSGSGLPIQDTSSYPSVSLFQHVTADSGWSGCQFTIWQGRVPNTDNLYMGLEIHSRANNNYALMDILLTGPSDKIYFDLVSHRSGDHQFTARSTTKVSCGSSEIPWKAVYATTGSIQTSDRSAKHDIHYLSDSSTTTVSEDGQSVTAIGLPEVIEFIQNMEPATFIYNDSANNKATDDPSNRQLGLIADDLESLTLFPYIGGRYTWAERKDDDGNIEVPAGTSLALKPIPLAVAALTACKYLLQRLEIVEDKLAS